MSKRKKVFKGDEDIQYLQQLQDASASSADDLSEDISDFTNSDEDESGSSSSESEEEDVAPSNVSVNRNDFHGWHSVSHDHSNMEIVQDPMIDVQADGEAAEDHPMNDELIYLDYDDPDDPNDVFHNLASGDVASPSPDPPSL